MHGPDAAGPSSFEARPASQDERLRMTVMEFVPQPRLRPDRHVLRWPGFAQGLGQPRELAQQRPRLAGIDDLLDPELFGRAERRAQLVQPRLDLLQLLRLVLGRINV